MVRITPPDDATRLAENLQNYDRNITDRDSFDKAYDRYLEGQEEALNNDKLRDDAFAYLLSKNNKIKDTSLHKRAGGKNLQRDRKKTSQEVVHTKKEYIKKGANKVDLKGYDTLTYRKDTIVYARKVTIKHSTGKVVTRYRDRRGRFVKNPKK